MMKWCWKNNIHIELIMKQSSFIYLQFQIEDQILGFKDVLQYTVPCPLSKFLKQWKVTESKGIFPHG